MKRNVTRELIGTLFGAIISLTVISLLAMGLAGSIPMVGLGFAMMGMPIFIPFVAWCTLFGHQKYRPKEAKIKIISLILIATITTIISIYMITVLSFHGLNTASCGWSAMDYLEYTRCQERVRQLTLIDSIRDFNRRGFNMNELLVMTAIFAPISFVVILISATRRQRKINKCIAEKKNNQETCKNE